MKLNIENIKGRIFLTVYDNDRKVASAAGTTLNEAATWLVKHVNRIAHQTEALIMDAQLLTETEIEAAAALLDVA